MNNSGEIEEYLFDIGNDMSETTNLFESSPDLVTEMKELLDKWEKEVKHVR
jgi:archaellum component FlaC